MSENPNDYSQFTEIQKMGRSMRIFGFARIGLILSSFLIMFIASSFVMQGINLETVEMEELGIALLAFMEQVWVQIYTYAFEAIVIAGLCFFVLKIYGVMKNYPEDQFLSKIFYFFLIGLIVAVVQFVGSIIMGNNIILIWIVLILNLAIPSLAIPGYMFMGRWSMVYEQQMGASFPILSSRVRRLMIGEILVLSGTVSSLFSILSGSIGTIGDFFAIFTIIGEIFVGSNLIRSGKLLELDTLPQVSSFPSEQPRTPTNQEYPEYKQPERLIPDEIYYCPSCGAKLESESQDFCIKCGRSIPKSEE